MQDPPSEPEVCSVNHVYREGDTASLGLLIARSGQKVLKLTPRRTEPV